MTTESFLAQVETAAGDPERVLQLALAHFRGDTGTIHELGPDGLLHLKSWAGGIPEQLLAMIRTIPVGKGIAGLAVERKEPVNLCNLQTDNSGQARPGARQTGVKGSICVPIMVGDQAVGALGIGTHEERDFGQAEIEVLTQVGRLIAQHTHKQAR